MLDPVTRIETRRDYSYTTLDGKSSGVLLHAPRFAFAVPTAGSTSSQQWQDATVRCGDDMGADPFESRLVGYQRVTELLPGRGQTITEFTAPGGADAVSDSDIPPGYDSNSITWARPVIGVASPVNAFNICPAITPLPGGTDLYPFAISPALDYLRGLPQRITQVAEPVGQKAGIPVSQQLFSYINQGVSPGEVTGVVYERAGTTSAAPYFYAQSKVVTGYQVVPRTATTVFYDAGGRRVNTLLTMSAYNAYGWLAAVARQNSDGSYERTRYRYLADYPSPGTETGKAMELLREQGIGSEIIETIAETAPPHASSAEDIHFKESLIQTYAREEPRNPAANPPFSLSLARPYQLWRYAAQSPRRDTTSLPGDASYPGWLVTTVQEIDRTTLTPVTTRLETGRQTRAQHLGYYNTVPVLQITGAKASEVVFSDCEVNSGHVFQYSSAHAGAAGDIVATDNPKLARTGRGGIALGEDDIVSHALPLSDAAHYRLAWWARSEAPVDFAVSIRDAQSGVWSNQSVSLKGKDWQRLEVVLPDLSSLSRRQDYQVQLSARNRVGNKVDVQVDDILLLPAEAAATSVTYDPTLGKTSETDDRGRTLYYEYDNSGKLARVRDQHQAIVRQVEQVVAGQLSSAVTTPTYAFAITGNRNYDSELTFTAYGPRRADLKYTWDFGDGTTGSEAVATHTYPIQGSSLFDVKLTVSSGAATTGHTTTQQLFLTALPLYVHVELAGVTGVDDCGTQPVTTTNSTTNSTTFTAVPNLPGRISIYHWETSYVAGDGLVGWETLENQTGASLTIQGTAFSGMVRCQVYDDTTAGWVVSEPVGVGHYKSDPTCQ